MTSPVDTAVKFFASTMAGAPTLNGVAGSIIDILNSCLVTGFGSKTATSLIVASGIATFTHTGGQSAAQPNAVIQVDGVTGGLAGLNGEQKVLTSNATTVTFATALADGTAAGTITMKIAPAGWTKPFTGTNLAAFRNDTVTGTGSYLRVDDTATQNARVLGYLTMSDINTGTNAFPLEAQVSGGDWWTKSSAASATAAPWFIFADNRMVYFARAYNLANPTDFQLSAFGDVISTKSSDPYCAIISGEISNVSSANVAGNLSYYYASAGAASGMYSPRSYTGIGSSIPMGKTFPALNGLGSFGTSGGNTSGTPFPNPTDGGVYVVPHYVFEAQTGGANVHRGVSPGFYCSPQLVPNSSFSPGDLVTGVTGLSGRVLKALTCVNSTPKGVCFFDVTGPWR